MKTLYLETATEQSLIALVLPNKTILHPMEGGPFLSKNMAKELQKLLTDHAFQPDQIFVGKGPGSLTGVRVGMALAKALGFGWKIPVHTFCSLSIFSPLEEGAFAILVDAKMSRFHLLKGTHFNGVWSYEELQTVPTNEVPLAVRGTPLLISPHPDLVRERTSLNCRKGTPQDCFAPLKLLI